VSRRFRLLSLPVVLAASVTACGGSSSETPPPLEPLPVNLHYDRASTALSGEVPVSEADAGGPVIRREELPLENEATTQPARSTWGSERGSAPAPATPLK
jgi:hypothetical protein